MRYPKMQTVLLTAGLGLLGCGAEEAGLSATPPSSRNVTQGGARDFARFRSLVMRGEVPSPDTLDEVGFFAEHALDLPPADCGEDICVHPALAVAPRFDGGNWTMSYVAMNSPVDPASLERPPAHVVLAWEATEAATEGDALRRGLAALEAGLRSTDRLSVVWMGATPEVLVRAASPGSVTASVSQGDFRPSEAVGLYDGLAVAGALADEGPGLGRVLLVSTGVADAGITSHARIVALAEGLAADGVSLSVFARGEEEAQRLPFALGEIGAGTFAFATDADDLVGLLEAEGRTGLVPLARRFELTVQAAPGYSIGEIYGASRVTKSARVARLEIPALYLGQRTGAQDVDKGRRGGGGGLFVELVPDRSLNIGANRPAAEVEAHWLDVLGPTRAVQSRRTVRNGLPPGQNPAEMWPEFSDPSQGKAFMMLNMYLAFRAAVDFFARGDCDRALGLVDMMEPSIAAWQAEFSDPDIDEDRKLLIRLRSNLERRCADANPFPPRDAVTSCFGI